MDLLFTDEQNRFREELRAWFAAHGPKEALAPPYAEPGFSQHMEWERTLYEAGYAAPAWPVHAGGRGLDAWHQLIYDEEYARFGLPERLNKMGLVHGGPTVLAHGTDEQKQRWLPGILSCENIWCQGFSEPEAGSDLANLKTTGRVEGDELVVDGQKTWTSQGIIADTMFALVRTDPTARKHRGISFVVIDMRTPGVEIRPLTQLHGNAGFAEVFFSGVRVPLGNVVGELNDGWRVAQTSLQLERGTGRGTHTRMAMALHDVADDVARLAPDDTGVLGRLGDLAAWTYAYEQAAYCSTDMTARNLPDDHFSSVVKIRLTELQTAIHEEHLAVLGHGAEIPDWMGPDRELRGMHRNYWHGRAAEIFAGSNEIQKNIIAERMLGLPKEPRP
ncbi:acyl-CoA dehydrogenase family protein [Pseudonocardia kunmingensis]|uniref:Alkylation response protein AidB-like acyl-CoA dehydrogenase n=1 Tax=Pseudonocardia kunmingensis TaxID=630975 RepID=A0A543D0C6_9PSEU|nr:acyl-CoA dehydrogenase family protein [Pseudonocardia kunmingensis]TQM02805.1 alkylation response protein AidB-like acyl-CoA dehydrogenase [Pseudonocardia kunmingensis]